jgi:hypothetical protein
MAMDTAKRYAKIEEFSNIEVFDETGNKVMADGGMMAKGGEVNHPKDLIGFSFTNGNKSWQIISYGHNIHSSSPFRVLEIKEITNNLEDIGETLFMTPSDFANSFSFLKYTDGKYTNDKISKFKDYKSEEYADGGITDEATLSNLHKNFLGTVSFDLKLKGMRKAQDFIVYPITAEDADKPIMVQSETRIGKIDLETGRGLMSKSHPNGAYFVHYQMDPKTRFMLSTKFRTQLHHGGTITSAPDSETLALSPFSC